jgi:glucokinase
MPSSNSGLTIGIDLGGTKIRAAVVDRDGRVIGSHLIGTDVAGGPEKVLADILDSVRGGLGTDLSAIEAIGVGVAGQVDPASGLVRSSPNLKWESFPFGERLSTALDIPVVIDNDVQVATWGEWQHGAGRGVDDLLVIFVGTGVGGGAVTGGRLLTGRSGLAGEMGHVTIVAGGRQCTCPNQGCLEAYVGGWAIAERAVEAMLANPDAGRGLLEWAKGEEITARLVGELAATGDPLATDIMDRTGQYLGAGLVGLIHVFEPARVVFGGGVIEGSPDLVHTVESIVRANAIPAYTYDLEFVRSELGTDAGVIGSASLALERVVSRRRQL